MILTFKQEVIPTNGAYIPAKQLVQLIAPAVLENEPTAQRVHTFDWYCVDRYSPALQAAVHAVELLFEKNPLGHCQNTPSVSVHTIKSHDTVSQLY
jgi:hypothetical protein